MCVDLRLTLQVFLLVTQAHSRFQYEGLIRALIEEALTSLPKCGRAERKQKNNVEESERKQGTNEKTHGHVQKHAKAHTFTVV